MATYVNGRNSGKVFVVGGEVDSAGDAVGERGELGLDVAHGDHGLRRAVRQAVSPFRNCVAGHCYKKKRSIIISVLLFLCHFLWLYNCHFGPK